MKNKSLPNQDSHVVCDYDRTVDSFDSILDHMSQGLIFIDSQEIVRTYNSSAESILGMARSKVLLHKFSEVFADHFFGFSMIQALQSTRAPKTTHISLNSNEDEREVEIEISFVLKQNQAMGMILLLRDITEIKYLQTIAHRTDRMKELGEIATMIAHDIHNPLAGIKGFATLLVRDLQNDPKLQEMAAHILSSTDRLNQFVNQILNYAKPLQLDLMSTEMSALLDEVIQQVKMDYSLRQNISVQFIVPQQPVFAAIDSQHMKSALINLIVNAVQAMPEQGGTIELFLKDEKKRTVIGIKDTGIGISAKNLEKIFTPFFTTKPDGHGFGLAEVHRIIHEHHGEICVESNEGQGALFTIKLPKNMRSNGN